MAQLHLTLNLVTPLLMFGALNGARGDTYFVQPEIRTASLRGGLRYWLRALYGAAYGSNTTGLYEAESRIFGSTSRGSAVTLHVQSNLKPVDFDPNENYKRNDQRRDNGLNVLPERFSFAGFKQTTSEKQQQFNVLITSHPLRRDVFSPAFSSSLILAFTLGGFGKRARRGGGNLQIINSDKDISNFSPPTNLNDGRAFATYLRDVLFPFCERSIVNLPELKNIDGNILEKIPCPANVVPAYPMFAPDHCRVFVGTKGDSDYLKALKQLWTLTGSHHRVQATDKHGRPLFRENKHGQQEPVLDRWPWGYVRGKDRRASAIHMRVYQCVDRMYYPIVTIFRGGLRDENWSRIQDVVSLFETHPDFIRTYGTLTKW